MIDGKDYPDGQINRIAFGKHAMVYVGANNDLISRTKPCVALCDSNNIGDHYFMSLKTGKRLYANK